MYFANHYRHVEDVVTRLNVTVKESLENLVTKEFLVNKA